MWRRGWAHGVGVDLADLLWPRVCPGCGLVDTAVCEDCLADLIRGGHRADTDHPALPDFSARPPIWAGSWYAGPARKIVLAWKDHGRLDLDPIVAAVMNRVTRTALPQLRSLLVAIVGPLCGMQARLAIVPMPASASGRRTRGRNQAAVLAASVANELCAAGLSARMTDSLGRKGGRGRQANKSAQARAAARRGSTYLRRPIAQRFVIVVDDVLTTGATLRDGIDALRQEGHVVLAAIVLGATPPGR